MNLTQEDVKNILVLINKAPITGIEAATVTELQKKLTAMVTPAEEKPVVVTPEPTVKDKK